MRLTRQAAFAIALVCGLLAGILAWVWVKQQKKPVPKPPETVQIPVPIKAIPPQVDLKAEMFKTATFDRDKVPNNAIPSMPGLEGHISLTQLPADQPVRVTEVAVKSEKLGMAYGIPQGLRGMCIALDVVGTVGDFVQPGNRVDVLVSFEKDGNTVVRTVVQDVLVLAKSSSTNIAPPPTEEGKGGTKNSPPTRASSRKDIPVTLAVTPEQAQLILTSDIAGTLRLLLRPMGDNAITTLPSSNSWSLIGKLPAKSEGQAPSGGAAPLPPPTLPYGAVQPGWGAPPTQPPTAPQRPSVEVIRGSQRELVTPGS